MLGSLFYGGMLGVFVLAFFFPRVRARGAFYGVLVGEAAIFACWVLHRHRLPLVQRHRLRGGHPDRPPGLESGAETTMRRVLPSFTLVCALLATLEGAQAPVPGPEDKKLEALVGVWRLEGSVKAVPEVGSTDSGESRART